jgi:hypothetical protein
MGHWIKNTATGFVELIVQFINAIGCFFPGIVLAGLLFLLSYPVSTETQLDGRCGWPFVVYFS